MPTSETTFGLTPAQLHHNLELGSRLGSLIRRLLGLAPVAGVAVGEPVAV